MAITIFLPVTPCLLTPSRSSGRARGNVFSPPLALQLTGPVSLVFLLVGLASLFPVFCFQQRNNLRYLHSNVVALRLLHLASNHSAWSDVLWSVSSFARVSIVTNSQAGQIMHWCCGTMLCTMVLPVIWMKMVSFLDRRRSETLTSK